MKPPRFFTRRELLGGLAAAPLFGTLLRSSRARAQGVTLPRFCWLFYGNGAHPQWTPTGAGAAMTLSPQLQPLDAIRSEIVVFKNLTHLRNDYVGHNRSSLGILTGTDSQQTNPGASGSQVSARAPSLDQTLASLIARGPDRAPIHSLQVGNLVNPTELGTGPSICHGADAPHDPIPPERDPLKVYQRLVAVFTPGSSGPGDTAAAMQKLRLRQSVLDGVRGDLASLRARVSAADRDVLDSHLTSLRTLEAELSIVVTPPPGGAGPGCAVAPAAPQGQVLSAANLADHQRITRLHLDLVAFALGCGLTRVATVQLSDGSLNYTCPWLGLTRDAHSGSHYLSSSLGTAVALANITTLMRYWYGELAYFVDALKTRYQVLRDCIVVMATQNGDSDGHLGTNTPVVLAGNAGGAISTGGRLQDCQGRFNNDLLVAIAHAMGFPQVGTFGQGFRRNLNAGPLPLT